jgi:hypothetical protein
VRGGQGLAQGCPSQPRGQEAGGERVARTRRVDGVDGHGGQLESLIGSLGDGAARPELDDGDRHGVTEDRQGVLGIVRAYEDGRLGGVGEEHVDIRQQGFDEVDARLKGSDRRGVEADRAAQLVGEVKGGETGCTTGGVQDRVAGKVHMIDVLAQGGGHHLRRQQ